jgi:hypothetical protein
VGPRAGLDVLKKKIFLNLPELELGLLSHPARSQSLYRLRYLDCRTEYRLEQPAAIERIENKRSVQALP